MFSEEGKDGFNRAKASCNFMGAENVDWGTERRRTMNKATNKSYDGRLNPQQGMW